ncbi:MAG: tRNA (guanine(46)-N(7))-methyltransferase TrmB [Pseudomonadota bacterium]
MTDPAEQSPRRSRASEAFFGRRKGKTLRPAQQAVMEKHLPSLRVEPAEKFPGFDTLFPGRADRKVFLEIGFGGGEHLDAERLRQPDVNFLGVEPFVNGFAKFLAAFDRSPTDNLRLYDDDATRILDWLPEASVDRIDLLYPDPWPKMKHFKRRFVNEMNLARFLRVLKPGGVFRFASDIDSYQNWTLELVSKTGELRWTAKTSSDWHVPWEHWVRTRYEAKAIREGRRPGYFVFQRSH